MTQRRSLLTGLAGIMSAGFAPAAIGSNILMPVKKIYTRAIELPYQDLVSMSRPPGQLVDGRGWDIKVRDGQGHHIPFRVDDVWVIRPEDKSMDLERFKLKFYQ